MGSWPLQKSDLKRYPHFDPWISAKDAVALATDPSRVSSHKFYPLMLYKQRWTRFAEKGKKGQAKERPIRYAARGDSYIFSYYRKILAELYETALQTNQLEHSVIAYRKIPLEGSGGGKCNIHFAQDAVRAIQKLENCCVVALDVSSYFESLDHNLLKSLWCRMLGVSKLPTDHFQVFKAITSYSVVEKTEAYRRLGHFGLKRKTKLGQPIFGYLTPYNQMPRQLCTGKQFRQLIAGENGNKSLIKKNSDDFGIPQGAPISDLLANLYLLDFDCIVQKLVSSKGGFYFRYSDDMLIIIPGGENEGQEIMAMVRKLIQDFGSQLVIKEKKSSIVLFEKNGDAQTCKLVFGSQGRNGLEYLGFRYDGRHVYLRDSTLSNLYRKITRSARYAANSLARRYPNKNEAQLLAMFDYEALVQKFGKVKDFGEHQQEYQNWTFWTYARRAAEQFGPLGKPIFRQLKSYRENVIRRAKDEIVQAVKRRKK